MFKNYFIPVLLMSFQHLELLPLLPFHFWIPLLSKRTLLFNNIHIFTFCSILQWTENSLGTAAPNPLPTANFSIKFRISLSSSSTQTDQCVQKVFVVIIIFFYAVMISNWYTVISTCFCWCNFSVFPQILFNFIL